MQPFPNSETATVHQGLDPTVMISMCDDQLVICPPAHLDLETTAVLVTAAASAVSCGSTVMVDLDPGTASDELTALRPLSAFAPNCVAGDGGPVSVLGAGYVRLTTRDALWTIDLANGRLCRSDEAIEPRFIGLDDWTAIKALWVTATGVVALSSNGTYLSTHATWTAGHSTRRPAHA